MTHDILKEAIIKKAECQANIVILRNIMGALSDLEGLNGMEQDAVKDIRKKVSILFDGQLGLLADSNGFIKDMLAEMTEIKGEKE